ncbi:MAG: hypothetical protein AB1589_07490 [Cyanobacteriota bacterium]
MYPTQFDASQDELLKSAELTTVLNNVWRDIWQVFGTYESWLEDSAKCNDIQQRLFYFSQSHLIEPDYIDDVIQALSRGFYLTQSAMQWQEPAAGCNTTDNPNATHKARGVQWRLVMAYGGFETTIKTLLKPGKSLNPEAIKVFTDKCDLPAYRLLTPPDQKQENLEKWLKRPSRQGKTALADFLSLDNGDQKIIESWIVKSTPISSWVEAARLAKAVRNATAHGALSATKVRQWGLENALLTLSDNLGEIVVAGLQKLL